MSASPWTFCVAPMLDWTTRECRLLHRQFSTHARLYTEMVTTGAIIYGDIERHLRFYDVEHPVALQLGGGDPDELARAVALAQPYGYDEINLNVGCPSDRVQNNRIGACLMDDAALVARCLRAMQRESDVAVTIKHRLGIDAQDERGVVDFVEQVASASDCQVFIVHARKAWLDGLSPKANRDIPPLNYNLVYELKQRFDGLTIVLNGGIDSMAACQTHLAHLDGVMLGRAAYQQPELLLAVDGLYGGEIRDLQEVLPRLRDCMQQGLDEGVPLTHFTRHILGLFSGRPGARQFRRILSEQARAVDADITIWDRAVASLNRSVVD